MTLAPDRHAFRLGQSLKLAACVLPLALAACEPPEPPPEIAFKFATFNVQLRPDLADLIDPSPVDEIPEREALLAEHIIRSNYDVVVLEEAFSADELMGELASAGYHVLAWIGEPTLPGGIDPDYELTNSGLAVASKFEFVDLGPVHPAYSHVVYRGYGLPGLGSGVGFSGGLSPNLLAFSKFEACDGDDCKAEKGVALVRVRHPSGEDINLVWTHLQVSGNRVRGSLQANIRSRQIDVVNRLLRDILGDDPDTWSPTLFAGDLNLRGDVDDEEGRWEWDDHLSPTDGATPPSATIRHSMVDVWEVNSFPARWLVNDPSLYPEDWRRRTDPGHTSGPYETTRERVDMIFSGGSSTPRLCFQHPRKDLGATVRRQSESNPYADLYLSDHWQLVSEVTTWSQYCSPAQAFTVETSMYVPGPDGWTVTLDAAVDPSLHLQHDSSNQWFLVTYPGTYLIDVERLVSGVPERDSTIVFEVYRTSDLSTKVRPYPGGPVAVDVGDQRLESARYALGDSPFFVKISRDLLEPDGRVTDYRLKLHLLNGSSPETAIALHPSLWYPPSVRLPTLPSTMSRTQWFILHTVGPFDPETPQRLRFQAEAPSRSTSLSLSLLRDDATTVVGLCDDSGPAPCERSGFIEVSRPELNWRWMYVAVDAAGDPLPPDGRFRWTTNLTVVPTVFRDEDGDGEPELHAGVDDTNLLTLKAVEQTDFTGDDDDIQVQLQIDGRDAYPDTQRPNLGDFDSGESRVIAPRIGCSIAFLRTVDVTLWEDDDFLNFEDDVLNGVAPILPLDELSFHEPGRVDITGGGGRYQLFYEVTHFSPSVHISGDNWEARSWSRGATGDTPPTCRSARSW